MVQEPCVCDVNKLPAEPPGQQMKVLHIQKHRYGKGFGTFLVPPFSSLVWKSCSQIAEVYLQAVIA